MVEPNLFPEDDDLLSYFLATEINAQAESTQLLMENAVGGSTERFNSFTSNDNIGRRPSAFNSTIQSKNTFSEAFSADNTSEMVPKAKPSPIIVSPIGKSTTTHVSDENERRQRRLARNRESARQSRRRKKQYLELLEEKVTQLTEEIGTFRRIHLESCGPKLHALKLDLIKTLDERLKFVSEDPSVIEPELDRGRKMIQERFGPNCEERQIVTEYHFQQLFSLLLPPYTKFLLWLSLQQDDYFKASSSIEKSTAADKTQEQGRPNSTTQSLWPLLSNELGLTNEQEESIKDQYKCIDNKSSQSAVERRRLSIAMEYLEKLRATVAQRAAAVQSHSDKIHSILTPSQSIKYIAWVEKNREKLQQGGIGKGFAFTSFTSNSHGRNDQIGNILKKSDKELTVEDITVMLSALSQQTTSSSIPSPTNSFNNK